MLAVDKGYLNSRDSLQAMPTEREKIRQGWVGRERESLLNNRLATLLPPSTHRTLTFRLFCMGRETLVFDILPTLKPNKQTDL